MTMSAARQSPSPVSDAAVSLVIDSRCELGECVLWDERRAALFWTDITARRLWMYRPRDALTRTWEVPDPLGCFALCDDGRLLLGLAKDLRLFDPDGPEASLPSVAVVEGDVAHTRINDGRCDRDGNFVFGTKSGRPRAQPRGSYYQFSFAHGLRRLDLPDATIPNSICFSKDGRTLYFCDSTEPAILCCDYEPHAAAVACVRVFTKLDSAGSPDGSCIDAHGCLWNAQWGAGRVVRYRPDGTVDAIVAVPVRNPSCCTIGGPALDRVYVSSARAEMSPDDLAATPQAGGIFEFAVRPGTGSPENRVALR